MIPGTVAWRQPARWQRELAQAVTDPAELLELLGLDAGLLPAARAAAREFPLRVPRGFVARMRRGDAGDPLLRQVLPLADETRAAPGYGDDPVGDRAAMVAPGVLRKYHGRVLLTVTGACAVHCRYCFRRQFSYQAANPATEDWQRAFDCLRADPSVEEVILSGGDPLALGDRRLTALVQGLAGIAHLRRLRLHSRFPIVLPERITAALLAALTATRLSPVLVVHANHAQEIDDSVRRALRRCREAGIVLLNQSVLLRGVNDDAAAIARLSKALFDAGVLPYYLHMLDRVVGAAHFEVTEAQALGIMRRLREHLPGYLVPRLVREVAGAASKQPLERLALDPVSDPETGEAVPAVELDHVITRRDPQEPG
jgi:EF-P beta-lysylation protein EpmB